MEEAIAVLLQVFFEIGIQLLGSFGIDFSVSRSREDGQSGDGCGWLVLHAVFGGLLGWISTLIVPKLILPFLGLRVLALVLNPFFAGGLSYLLFSKVIQTRKETWKPVDQFWHAFTFALFFGLARFAFGTR